VKRLGWHPEVEILVDRRPALAPFWDDYDWLLRRLADARGSMGLRIVYLERDGSELVDAKSKDKTRPYWPSGQPLVFALGDLGMYEGGTAVAAWLGLGRRLRRRGMAPSALCPCPRDRWNPSLTRVWLMAHWDRGAVRPSPGRGQTAHVVTEPERLARVSSRRDHLHALLRLLSPAVRIERGLLRDMRLLLPTATANVGSEYDAFQSSYTYGQILGFSILPDKLKALREELRERVDPETLVEAVRLISKHHEYSRRALGAQEVLGLSEILTEEQRQALCRAGLLDEASETEARAHCRRLVAGIYFGRFGALQDRMLAFAGRALDRLQSGARLEEEMQALWGLLHSGPERDYPSHIDPKRLSWMRVVPPTAPPKQYVISVGGGFRWNTGQGIPFVTLQGRRDFLQIREEHSDGTRVIRDRPWDGGETGIAKVAAGVRALEFDAGEEWVRVGRISRPKWAVRMAYEREGLRAIARLGGVDYPFGWQLETAEAPERSDPDFLEEKGDWRPLQAPPRWAERLWVDGYGLAAEFRIREVSFVLRWIPPGTFRMGSPEDEPGRFDQEGPQHEVRITQGFWMGETPVTQGQWRAVVEEAKAEPGPLKRLLGKKTLRPAPSHFQGPAELPVESVSWEDCELYCRLMNGLLPEAPGFRLPTEAQWEYACRMGANGPPFTGRIRLEGDVLSPDLDPLAWYGGNSGEEIEVSNPQDSTKWLGKPHGSPRAGTHRVKLKQANAAGLYDVLGNVWEWCQDTWDATAYAKRQSGVVDPLVTGVDSAARVVRGGAWLDQARFCRAAYRTWGVPASRFTYLGLRLSAGQELQARGGGAAEGAERPAGEAEPGPEGRRQRIRAGNGTRQNSGTPS